ncbi:hypothetical protein M422DRAFT_776676 [Sphaerobolus stellatus SS14]|nr:hypothetical protein M422DRAFT_776676 [Sphaerobolus stellatus SS14]
MRLPGENLSLIVNCVLEELDALHGEIQPCQSIGLSLLSGFSLVSHKFRQIALREIFKTYHVTQPKHLLELHMFPDLFHWIRIIHAPVNIAVNMTQQDWERFTFLRSLHLDGSALGVPLILRRLSVTVQELSVPFDHSNDHENVLGIISRFKNLMYLRVLSCKFEMPPVLEASCDNVPPHHHDYSRMAAQILQPLVNLRVLQIDHYLTDTEVFEYHATQCPWNSASNAFCPTCWDRYGEQTAIAEMTCTDIIGRGLPNLEILMWKSWFTANAEGHSKVFILRSRDWMGCEQIQVKRERETIEAGWKKLRSGYLRMGAVAAA